MQLMGYNLAGSCRVSFLSLRTSFILCNVLVCRLRLEEFTKRKAVHFNSSSYFLLYIYYDNMSF